MAGTRNPRAVRDTSRRSVLERVQLLAGGPLAAVLGLVGRTRQPRIRGSLRLAGLSGEAEVRRDRWGVPHIRAGDLHDLFLTQGFVHGQDRLWQMDFNRRFAAGRLAELLGEEALPIDRAMRVLGLKTVADADVGRLPRDVVGDLDAYATGVNAAIRSEPLPLECRLLRYRPESWSPVDTLAWARVISWFLSCNWREELVRARLIDRLGEDEEAKLEPGRRHHETGIAELCTLLGKLGTVGDAESPAGRVGSAGGRGSNAWVIAGKRTASGSPILANDMHLSLLIPSIWYENHLRGGDLHLSGVTFPGVPGVVAGHNEHVAWGFTNGFADVQDLYLEHLHRGEDGIMRYEFREEWHEAEVRQERIQVRNGPTEVREVISTRHGPVINSLAPRLAGDQPLALRWTSLGPDTSIVALEELWRARNCDEVKAAFRSWTAPVQNAVYADVEGNIGYSQVGQVPIRARGHGQVPVPGWSGEYEWLEEIPYEEMPHLRNPASGYIITANNRPVFAPCAHFLGDDYCSENRAARITELIEAEKNVAPGTVARMQRDQTSCLARSVGGWVAQAMSEQHAKPPWVGLFEDWDGELAAGSPQAAFYEAFVEEALRTVLGPRLGELLPEYAQDDLSSPALPWCVFSEHARQWLASVVDDGDSQTPVDGRLDGDVLRRIGDEAAARLSDRLGDDPAQWSWGALHRLPLRHPLGVVALLRRFLDRGPFPVGGDSTTPWMEAGGGEGPMIGPPFRFVADLSNLSRCYGVLLPGQSGRPGTRHYDDQIEQWLEGRYHPMLFDRSDVEREATTVLRLLPG